MDVQDKADLFESACLLIEAYINLHPMLYAEPKFHETVLKDVALLLQRTVDSMYVNTYGLYEAYGIYNTHIKTIVEEGLQVYYKHIRPPRSSGPTFIRKSQNLQYMEKLQKKITYLQQVPQPEQRTPEWYEFRYQHLTASNIWKAFSTDSTKNQLIFEKCQPLNGDSNNKFNGVNIDSPLHWGQKYEPVSVQLYNTLYQTQVSDFGCIPHKTIDFLAASPDGIVIDDKSDRYGRMLEIKNIVNRAITGIPKIEYWIQMQVQLEVCDLNECDFLETRFIEYADEEAFQIDALVNPETQRGFMMLFMKMGGQPLYEYAPLNLSPAKYPEWQEEMMEKNKDFNWLKNIYWKLDQVSCVLVLRNKLWFAAALPALREIWRIIQEEKKSGYAHRAPKSKAVKNNTNNIPVVSVKKIQNDTEFIAMPSKCFITIET